MIFGRLLREDAHKTTKQKTTFLAQKVEKCIFVKIRFRLF